LSPDSPPSPPSQVSGPVLLALLAVLGVLSGLSIERYGIFRDELYYLACTDRPAWGYVDLPPLSIAVLRGWRAVFGDGVVAIRIPVVLCSAAWLALVLKLTAELGGRAGAQAIAGTGALFAPLLLGTRRFYSMNALDHLLWAAALLLLVRSLRRERLAEWIGLGVVVGLGLLNKYSMGFLAAAVAVGVVLTSHRRVLATKGPWIAAAIALALFAPHLAWEQAHDWPSLEFMRNAAERKNAAVSPSAFVGRQLLELGPLNALVWVAGLGWLLAGGARMRVLAIAYLLLLVFFATRNAKPYYLGASYPVLFAAGGVFWERRLRGPRGRRWGTPALVGALAASGLALVPFALPVLPVERFVAYQAALGLEPHAEERNELGALPQGYADMFGWRELADLVDRAWGRLSDEERARCVIYLRNYGEAGAVDYFGRERGWSPALCAHNSYWTWGPGDLPGDVAIIVGNSRDLAEARADLEGLFDAVELVGMLEHPYAMPFENGRHVFLCRGFHTSFQAIWDGEKTFL